MKVNVIISAVISFLILLFFSLISFDSCIYKFKEIIISISLAFLTSSIFFYFTVIVKNEKDKKNLLPFVAEKLLMIIIKERYFFKEMKSGSDVNISHFNPTDEDICSFCKAIDSSKDNNCQLTKDTFKNIEKYFQNLEKRIDSLFIFHDVLDSELRSILINIKNNSNSKSLNLSFSQEKNSLEKFSNDLIKFHHSINILLSYSKKKLNNYIMDKTLDFSKISK